MRIKSFLFLLTFLGNVCFAGNSFSFFIPPKEWLVADPKMLSPRVKIGFLTKGKKEFCPSLNLATEKVDLSLEEYLKVIKTLHTQNKNNQWRDLGNFSTRSGMGHLIEIGTKTPFGQARLLQLIFIKDKTAYVMTASALKEEFAIYYQEFQKAFQSLTITEDLFECREKESLKKAYEGLMAAWQKRPSPLQSFTVDEDFHERHFLPFQKKVMEECCEMGGYWQILMLQYVQEKLLK